MIDRNDFPVLTPLEIRRRADMLNDPAAAASYKEEERRRCEGLFKKYVADKGSLEPSALTLEELLDRFEALFLVAQRLYDGSDERFLKEHYVCKVAFSAIKQEIEARGFEALRALRRFYEHPDFSLRVEAAELSYSEFPEDARRCLRHILDLKQQPDAWRARCALDRIDQDPEADERLRLSGKPRRPLSLQVHEEDSPDEVAERVISEGLDAYNDAVAPARDWAPLWIIGRDTAGNAQAGLRAVTFFDWLSLSLLWVAEPYRRQGIGSRLLKLAEGVARSRGAANAYLDTFSFQAPGFYEKHGYREFARLDNLPPGHSRIWLVKRL